MGLDIIRGLEELQSHARGEIQLRTRVIEVPGQTAARPPKDGRLRNEPVYLDERVHAYLTRKADTKGVSLSALVNDLLKREIEIIEVFNTK